MKAIVSTFAAEKQFFALSSAAQDAIDEALVRYAISGHRDIKRLAGSDYFRLRVGRYRVVFDKDRTPVLAVYIGKRETTTYKRGRS